MQDVGSAFTDGVRTLDLRFLFGTFLPCQPDAVRSDRNLKVPTGRIAGCHGRGFTFRLSALRTIGACALLGLNAGLIGLPLG